MAHTSGIPKGSAPKVRNANRAPGYWAQLSNARSNRDRTVIYRSNRDWPANATGSAAYRRLH